MCFFRKTKYFYKGKLDWDERSSAGRYVRENCKALKVGTCCYCCCCFMLLSLALPFSTLGATFLFSHPYHWLCVFRYKHQLRVFARFSSRFLSRVCLLSSVVRFPALSTSCAFSRTFVVASFPRLSLVTGCAFSRAMRQFRVFARFLVPFPALGTGCYWFVRYPFIVTGFIWFYDGRKKLVKPMW